MKRVAGIVCAPSPTGHRLLTSTFRMAVTLRHPRWCAGSIGRKSARGQSSSPCTSSQLPARTDGRLTSPSSGQGMPGSQAGPSGDVEGYGHRSDAGFSSEARSAAATKSARLMLACSPKTCSKSASLPPSDRAMMSAASWVAANLRNQDAERVAGRKRVLAASRKRALVAAPGDRRAPAMRQKIPATPGSRRMVRFRT